jgi:cyclophilin family peptidyl-prolyl cis-trans isomerase
MLRSLLTVGSIAVVALTSVSALNGQAAKPATTTTTVIFDTSKGQIEIQTTPGDSPKSVERFLELAKRSFYRGQRFHFVQSDLVQVGDPLSRDMAKMQEWGKGGSGAGNKPRPLGVAEPSKTPLNRGVVALAYLTGYKPESADSQIFIFKVARTDLNGKYAVIGRVTKGMTVVDKIAKMDEIKMVTVK